MREWERARLLATLLLDRDAAPLLWRKGRLLLLLLLLLLFLLLLLLCECGPPPSNSDPT